MSDNKKHQGSREPRENRGASTTREDKSGAGSKRVWTKEPASKESRGSSSSKYNKSAKPARRFRDDEKGGKVAKESREEKSKISTKRQMDENVVDGKKITREKSEMKHKTNNACEGSETKIIREDLIEGRNAVIEALKSDRTIEYILIAKGDMIGSISVVLALAKEKGIVTKEVDRRKLDEMSQTSSHQGVMAVVTPYKYFSLNDIFKTAEERGEKPFIIILDEIEDPHNFGSIIRTAEVCGAHGIIIPKRRNVGATPTVYKTSAGAIEHVKIAKVTNINATIDEIKERGVWVYGADMDAESYIFNTDLTGAVALVIGSEGRGISKLTKEKCDVLVKIPMVGKITSLNASVAGGIIMYEIMKQKIR